MPLPLKKLLTKDDVDTNETLFEAVQGYTLVSHGRKHVWLGLVRFDPKTAAKDGLAKALCEYGVLADSALDLYRSYWKYRQLEAEKEKPNYKPKPDQIKADKETKDKVLFAVGLASPAYDLYPEGKPPSQEFNKGFVEQFKALAEVRDLAGSERYVAVVILASNKRAKVEEQRRQINKELKGLAKVTWETGMVKRVKRPGSKKRVVVDKFGFREGISQPVFFDIEPHRTSDWKAGWDPAVGLGCVLTQQPDCQDGTEYGSFMAYLKIEQNVDDFNNVVSAAAEFIADAKLSFTPVLANAKARAEEVKKSTNLVMGHLMGRNADGEPLAEPGSTDPNDFDFTKDLDFSRCPASAHIRKVNPRTDHHRNKRVLRRGVLYEHGTLFQCFQSELLTGFEHLFREWAMNENFPEPGAGKDAVLGNSASAAELAIAIAEHSDLQVGKLMEIKVKEVAAKKQELPQTRRGEVPPVAAKKGVLQYELKPFTKIREGEYFYFPSKPFFKRMIGHFELGG